VQLGRRHLLVTALSVTVLCPVLWLRPWETPAADDQPRPAPDFLPQPRMQEIYDRAPGRLPLHERKKRPAPLFRRDPTMKLDPKCITEPNRPGC
jgi:hypothetical protein